MLARTRKPFFRAHKHGIAHRPFPGHLTQSLAMIMCAHVRACDFRDLGPQAWNCASPLFKASRPKPCNDHVCTCCACDFRDLGPQAWNCASPFFRASHPKPCNDHVHMLRMRLLRPWFPAREMSASQRRPVVVVPRCRWSSSLRPSQRDGCRRSSSLYTLSKMITKVITKTWRLCSRNAQRGSGVPPGLARHTDAIGGAQDLDQPASVAVPQGEDDGGGAVLRAEDLAVRDLQPSANGRRCVPTAPKLQERRAMPLRRGQRAARRARSPSRGGANCWCGAGAPRRRSLGERAPPRRLNSAGRLETLGGRLG